MSSARFWQRRGLIHALSELRAKVEPTLRPYAKDDAYEEVVKSVKTYLSLAIEEADKLIPYPPKPESPKATKPKPLVTDPEKAWVVKFSPDGEEALVVTPSRHEAMTIADEIAKAHKLKTNGADLHKASREDIDGRTFKTRYLAVRI